MREIVLDTETTGLTIEDRIIEIGAVELWNAIPTGETFHSYVFTKQKIHPRAQEVHGISREMLEGQPTFRELAGRLMSFLGTSPLIIHNAPFDTRMVNAELQRCRRKGLGNVVIDTIELAKRRFPGAPYALNSLCQRFGISLAERKTHGALVDAKLLAEVYLGLIGRQRVLDMAATDERAWSRTERPTRAPRPHAPTDDELAAHDRLIAQIADRCKKADPLAAAEADVLAARLAFQETKDAFTANERPGFRDRLAVLQARDALRGAKRRLEDALQFPVKGPLWQM